MRLVPRSAPSRNPGTSRAAVLAVLLLATLTSGCAGSAGSDDPGSSASGREDVASLGHVHGLGVDPADATLYVASHFGVFRMAEGESPERVANRWQDTMAFTVAGPGHFLASGHPDLREDLPAQLGLIESTDAARTWQEVSLLGRADFHALEIAGGRVWGYDSLSGRLLTSSSGGKTWQAVARLDILDLAAAPDQPAGVLASTPHGVMRLDAATAAPEPVKGAPPMLLLDWPATRTALGVTGDGKIFRSDDGGASWLQVATAPPGQLHAFDATVREWHVATEQGVFKSEDQGRRWKPVWSS